MTTPSPLRREDHEYFKYVKRLLTPIKEPTLIDIGNGGTESILYGSFTNRYAIDPLPLPEREGVVNLQGEWPNVGLPCPVPVDVALCLQVIEHLQSPQIPSFIEALFSCAKSIIISVPYRWRGPTPTHPQDPIDERKLESLIQRTPNHSHIVTELNGGPQRLVCVYSGDRL